MAPIFEKIYYDNGWSLLTAGGPITNTDTIKYQIIYYFITIGAAFVGGLIAGIIALISR